MDRLYETRKAEYMKSPVDERSLQRNGAAMVAIGLMAAKAKAQKQGKPHPNQIEIRIGYSEPTNNKKGKKRVKKN